MAEYSKGVRAVLGHIEDALGEIGQAHKDCQRANMPYAAEKADREWNLLYRGLIEVKRALAAVAKEQPDD